MRSILFNVYNLQGVLRVLVSETRKHIFVFSEAGKPIYSRYGKEEAMVSLYGVMQALLSCVQDQDDDLKCIRTGDHFICIPVPLSVDPCCGFATERQ